MPAKTSLYELLDEFPDFYYREADGNHFKYSAILAEEIRKFKSYKTLVKLSDNLTRPIKLWRDQSQAGIFDINYEINLDNIKRVQLFNDVYDSPNLLSGIDSNRDNVVTGGDKLVSTAGFSASGSTITASTEWSMRGQYSIKCVTQNLAGSEGVNPGTTTSAQTYGLPITPDMLNKPITASIFVIGTGSVKFSAYGRDVNSAITETFSGGSPTTLSPDVPTRMTITVTPVNSATVSLTVKVLTGSQQLAIFWVDGLMYNEGTVALPFDVDSTAAQLYDSGVLPEGLNQWVGTYSDTSPSDVPLKPYYLQVDDYQENIYKKGFPENSEIMGDFYDHDSALDVLGMLYGIPRRHHVVVTDPNDYPLTYPPFCIDETEWDYTYENRIKEYMEEIKTHGLVAVEVKKYFQIFPEIEGRWRYITKQNADVMAPDANAKFMATAEWNSAVSDVSADLDTIPKNIEIPDVQIMQEIIDKCWPLGKKGYFNLTGRYPLATDPPLTDVLGFVDSMQLAYLPNPDAMGWVDSMAVSNISGATFPTEVVGFVDELKIGNILPSDVMSFVDSIIKTGTISAFDCSSDTEFSAQTLASVSVVGTGDSAYAKFAPVSTHVDDSPSGASQDSSGLSWTNIGYIYDTDESNYAITADPASGSDNGCANAYAVHGSGIRWYDPGAAADCSSSYYAETYADPGTWSQYLDLGDFRLSIPSGKTVTGVMVSVLGGGNSGKTIEVTVTPGSGSAKIKTGTLSSSNSTWMYFGNSTDMWGGLSTNYADYNGNNLGISIRIQNNGTNCDVRMAEITVYYADDVHESNIVTLSGLGVTVPSGSTVVGVLAHVHNYCETASKDMDVTLTIGGVTKTKSIAMSNPSSGTISYGSSTDMWGGLPSTPSSYSSITMKLQAMTAYNSRIYDVDIQIYYLLQDGSIATATITAPADGTGWDEVIDDRNVPAGTTLKYDVIRASDSVVLLSDQTPPIDISGLAYTNLKLKAKFHADAVDPIPSLYLYSFGVNYRKVM
jgi:hypothetical protein